MALYNTGKRVLFDRGHANTCNLSSDTMYVSLMKSAYTQDIDAHEFWDDVSSSEIVATDYPTGGQALAAGTFTTDTANDRAEWGADVTDETFTAIGGAVNDTFDEIILRKYHATPGSSPLLGSATVTETQTNGGDIVLEWNAQGILQFG